MTEATVYVGRTYGLNIEEGIACLHPDMMSYLGLNSGDAIEITGTRTGYARVLPMDPQDMAAADPFSGFGGFFDDFFTMGSRRPSGSMNVSTILLNPHLRDAVGAYIDQGVTVKKISVEGAAKVKLAAGVPIEISVSPDEFKKILRSRFNGRIITKGSPVYYTISRGFSGGESAVPFITEDASPSGPVMITENTEFELNRKNITVTGSSSAAGAGTSGIAKEEVSSDSAENAETGIRYEDIGGLNRELDQIREVVELPLVHPELFDRVGVEPPKGILLYGPPGTGKTLIAKAIANETKSKFIQISGPEIVSKYYGESEEQLRQKFEEAEKNAPAIIFIDEIDSIAPKRGETQGETERRIVAQLLTLMDGMKSRGRVIVIATTNRPDSIDEALRRGGRFDREIEIGVPDKEGRLQILKIHTKNMPLEKAEETEEKPKELPEHGSEDASPAENNTETPAGTPEGTSGKDPEKAPEGSGTTDDDIDDETLKRSLPHSRAVNLEELAEKTHGYVGADLSSLCKEAAMNAIRRLIPVISKNPDKALSPESLEKLTVIWDDFEKAFEGMEPSAMREAFVEIPNVRWADIGGLGSEKQELSEAVEWPLKYPDAFRTAGIRAPKGVLLYGPPGTGKTMLAKAVANESGANFISVKGPELFNKFVGETEKNIRTIFKRAKQAAPTVIFFDEIDAIAAARSGDSLNHVQENAVSQILTELDGVEELKNVVVVASTNRPDILDPALLRPGRFDRLVYVKPPSKEAREEIFRVHLKGKKLSANVDISKLADETEGYVGADIDAVCREAGMIAMRDVIRPGASREDVYENMKYMVLTNDHFTRALKKVRPTTSRTAMSYYDKVTEQFARGYDNNDDEKGFDSSVA